MQSAEKDLQWLLNARAQRFASSSFTILMSSRVVQHVLFERVPFLFKVTVSPHVLAAF
jgi:hypothetical protein